MQTNPLSSLSTPHNDVAVPETPAPNQPATPPPAVPKKRRFGPAAVSMALLLSLLVLVPLGYFYGGQVVRLLTNQGQIVVAADATGMQVVVKEKGVVLEEGPGRHAITVAAGPHELELTIKDAAGETRSLTKQVTVSRGGHEVIDVRQELALAPKPKTPEPQTKPSDPSSEFNNPDPPEPMTSDPQKREELLTVDLGGNVRMRFVLIDPRTKPDGGHFQMGSPAGVKAFVSDEQQHDVELTKPYYLAKYPVTQAQYQRITGMNPSRFKDDHSGRLPVEQVSWNDAQEFCKELMKKAGEQLPAALRQSKYRFALPTEAQWEYACRAGTKTTYYFGNDPKMLDEYAWYEGNSGEHTHPVGEKKPNAWGLYDMNGNVWQWCEDYYGPYSQGLERKDPLRTVQHVEDGHVLRGGSCYSDVDHCRAAYRSSSAPEARNGTLGFRVALRPE